MELTQAQELQIQKTGFEMFKSFIEVCNKLGLKYYILGGTMLGAVRHNGFIPWDDDIDVGMPRTDYNVFMQRAQLHLPNYYFLQNFESDIEYPLCCAKIRDSRTAYIETAFNDRKINHGVFMDIFPLDYYPDSKIRQVIFDKKMSIYDKKIRDSLNMHQSKSLKSRLLSIFVNILLPDVHTACVKKNRLMSSVKKSNTVANICGAWGKREYVPAEWFGNGVMLKFESICVSAPIEYDKWLTKVYGDYMSLPPEEKRKAHHAVDIIDFDKSYTEYIK